jgi:hypothetical protein
MPADRSRAEFCESAREEAFELMKKTAVVIERT